MSEMDILFSLPKGGRNVDDMGNPPDPIAAQPDDVVAWTTGTNTPGGQAVIQVADGMQLPPGTKLCLADALRREREARERAEAERNALRQHLHDEHQRHIVTMDERDRIAAECERLRTDAERYRHIRPMFRAFSAHVDGMHSWCATGELARMKGPTFDAAIDAARKV